MILRRLILLSAVIGALAVSGIAALYALIFTLHTLAARWLGEPGGWAALFGLLALTLAAAALVASAMARGKRRKTSVATTDIPVMDIADRFAELVRERPVAALSTVVGAGVLAVRDPGRLATAVRRFAAGADVDDR